MLLPACKNLKVIIAYILLLVRQLQEPVVNLIQLIRFKLISQKLKPVFQCGPSAPCGKHDCRFLHPHLLGIYDLIVLPVFQHAVLVYSRGVGKGIPADNSLVGLDRHPHQRGNNPAGFHDLPGINTGIKIEGMMRFNCHHHLFK